jgi:dihydropteroate synthase
VTGIIGHQPTHGIAEPNPTASAANITARGRAMRASMSRRRERSSSVGQSHVPLEAINVVIGVPEGRLRARGPTISATMAARIMGILNVTPDSFSDGGEWFAFDRAVEHARRLIAEGADILDIGGESTRPRAEPVAIDEELRRVVPVVRALRGADVQISIDTAKLTVAEAAVDAGATFVNDVTAFRQEPELAGFVADRRCDCCLMHMLGEPRTMQDDPRYDNVVDDVRAFLEERVEFAVREGVREERIMVDPGIGFGKTLEHNLELLRRLDRIATIGLPVVIGTSRKSFLGRLTGRDDPHDRVAATVATTVLALERGASVFRVHDVAPTKDALAVATATLRADGA